MFLVNIDLKSHAKFHENPISVSRTNYLNLTSAKSNECVKVSYGSIGGLSHFCHL